MAYDLDKLTRGVQDPAVRAALQRLVQVLDDVETRLDDAEDRLTLGGL